MVEFFDFGIRIVLASVLAVAATGKVFDPTGTRISTAAFGIPGRFITGIAVALPALEFAIPAILIIPVSAEAGAMGALLRQAATR